MPEKIKIMKHILHKIKNNLPALLLVFSLVTGMGMKGWGQVNITPIRTDVSGFPTWTDVDIAGTTYLQLLLATSATTTPAMNFNAYTSEVLNFKARTYGGTNTTENTITVWISTNNGVDWISLGTRTPSNSTMSAMTAFDLSAYSGTQVKVKFTVAGTNTNIGAGIDDIDIKGVALGGTPPTLTAAVGATVDAPFDVTFTDDATWRGAITSITVDGTTLTSGYSISSGKITFTPSASVPANLLQVSGSKNIAVVATGYSTANVTQVINAGVATKLGMKTQPAAPPSNGGVLATQPAVYIQDQYGNTTTSTATVDAAVGAGTWTLGGTTGVAAVAGTTTYSGLTATSAAAVTGATIAFTSTGLTGITSGTFNIPAPTSPEPSNHATGFSAAPDGYSQITVIWTDASLGQIPSGYLVKAAIDPATPVAPGDGVPETDALLVKNIAQGVHQAVFTGLNAGTKYNFAIWPYSNAGAIIDYKTIPDAPITFATTNSFTPPNHLVIAEVYGGGGNSGSVLSYDYVVLYNPTSADVSLTGWSVQIGSAASAAPTAKADLSGFITAYGYYVVRGAVGATGTNPLPVSYDVDGTALLLGATSGKVVLSNQPTLLTNYTDASIVDLVGYGTTATSFETAPASAPSNTTSLRRKDNSAANTYGITNGYDTDDNASNFYVATPTFADGPVRVYNYSSSAALETGVKGIYTRISLTGAGTTVTVNGNSTINSSLTINSGKLEISSTGQLTCTNASINNVAGNSGLVLKSTSTGTGSLIHSTAGVNATIERYITGAPPQDNATQYHLVSYPFRANYTSSVWTGSYLFDLSEATGIWNPVGAALNYQCYSNKGYLLYYPEASTTYTHTGVLKEDASSLPVTRTGASAYPGFNVLPNPYPCAIDFNVSAAWSSNIQDNKIWCWSSTSGNYGAFIRAGSGTNGVTNIIPVGQAFFVEATASGNVTIASTAKTHSSQAYYKSTEAASNLLRLKSDANSFSDEIIVQFRSDATTNYDAPLEARKMTGQQEAPQLSATSNDGENLSINALPFSSEDVIVPIHFTLVPAGEVTFAASGIETFQNSVPMYLEDLSLSKVINLREQSTYTFSHSGGDAGQRFQLRFKGVNSTPDQPTATEGSVFVSNGYLYIDVPSMQQTAVDVRVFDALGREFSAGKYTLSGLLQLQAPTATGVYVVRVQSGNKVFTAKVVVK